MEISYIKHLKSIKLTTKKGINYAFGIGIYKNKYISINNYYKKLPIPIRIEYWLPQYHNGRGHYLMIELFFIQFIRGY